MLAEVSSGAPDAVELICPAVKAGKNADKAEKRQAALHKRLAAIAKGGDINAADKNGQTALMYAAAVGNKPAACWLVAKGADVTLKSKSGKTAADYAEFPDIRELLELCAVPAKKSSAEGSNPGYAINLATDDLQEMAQKIAKGAVVSHAVESLARGGYSYDTTPLLTRIAYLVRCGYDVNSRTAHVSKGYGINSYIEADKLGMSATMSTEEFRLLLALGLRTDNADPSTRLIAALLLNDLPTAKKILEEAPELLKEEPYEQMLPKACRSAEAMRVLIEAGYKVSDSWSTREFGFENFHHEVWPVVFEVTHADAQRESCRCLNNTLATHSVDLVNTFLKAGIISSDEQKLIAMHARAEHKDVPAMRALLAAGVDLKQAGGIAAAPFALHSIYLNETDELLLDTHQDDRIPETIRFLIENGADVNATIKDHRSDREMSVLQLAVRRANTHGRQNPQAYTEGIRLLLKAGAKVPSDILLELSIDSEYARYKSGRFYESVGSADACNEIAELLIEHGADPTVKTPDGRTAFTFLPRLDSPTLVTKLIKAGLEPNAPDCNGEIAMQHVGTAEVAEILLKNGSPLKGATPDNKGVWGVFGYLGRVSSPAALQKLVDVLKKAGADPKATAADGSTALFFVYDPELVDILCKAGVDPDACKSGEPPICYLFREPNEVKLLNDRAKKPALLHSLLCGGAFRTTGPETEKMKEQLLRLIARVDNISMRRQLMEVLAKAGWDINPIWWAVRSGYVPVTDLLDLGATPDYKNDKGETPLMVSFQNSFARSSVEALINAKADVNAQDAEGNTFLMLLANAGDSCWTREWAQKQPLDKESLAGLLRTRAKLDLRNKAGKTALDIAREKNNTHVLELLNLLGVK